MEQSVDLPYCVEYKNFKRKILCKGCRRVIKQNAPFIFVNLANSNSEATFQKGTRFHLACFFQHAKENNITIRTREIEAFSTSKWEDQEFIRSQIMGMNGDVTQNESTLDAAAATGDNANLNDSSSNRSALSNLMANMTVANDDAQPVPTNSPIKEGRKRFIPRFKPRSQEEKLADKLKKQQTLYWYFREGFEKHLNIKDMNRLLEDNGQPICEDKETALNALIDIALFGKPVICPNCSGGRIAFSSARNTYVCDGYISEYTKCMYTCKQPVRSPFVLPANFVPTGVRVEHANQWLRSAQFNVLMSNRVYDPSLDSPDKPLTKKTSSVFSPCRKLKPFESFEAAKKTAAVEVGEGVRVVRGGTVVDPESGLQMSTRVYTHTDGTLYSITLGSCDLISNTNSYFKMQLLVDDTKDCSYLFESWGRVGTELGGNKTRKLQLEKAIQLFEDTFYTKTGNKWENRKYFIKKGGRMAIIDVDYSEFQGLSSDDIVPPGSRTTLHPVIQEIILSIFDVNKMKAAMKGFKIDTDRLPLGKLSKKQILSAYIVLSELTLILEQPNPSEEQIVDVTNRFYTLIPHNFGLNAAPPLATKKAIQEKSSMLDSLLEIEWVYGVLTGDGENTIDYGGRDPLDVHYEKLNCHMEYVDPGTEEYGIVKEYLTNTHAATHNLFRLELVDIVKVERNGESARFKKQLGNRKLLWHGSRLTNFAGILGQGLRIAPPEAPPTGYMFGKGVYFADMVTKSANYCRVPFFGQIGFLMLCDVALGAVQRELQAFPGGMNLLRRGFDSVQGVGETAPSRSIQFDGMEVPLGSGVKMLPGTQGINFKLLYNEYIVYNVDQVNIRYLVRAKFNRNV